MTTAYGKRLRATGELRRVPSNVTTSIPRGEEFLDLGLKLEEAE